MEEYLAIAKEGTGEIIEKKSRFLSYIYKVESEEEAVAYIEQIKKKHYDARHNCYAYSIGTGKQPLLRFSDDGEPQGTAGKPNLEVITGSGVRNILIVVTRYFGGTLLGTGGLVRAYTDAAKDGLENSEIVLKRPMVKVRIQTNYTDMGKLQYLIANEEAELADTIYTEVVELIVHVYEPRYGNFEKAVTEATSARAVIIKEGTEAL